MHCITNVAFTLRLQQRCDCNRLSRICCFRKT